MMSESRDVITLRFHYVTTPYHYDAITALCHDVMTSLYYDSITLLFYIITLHYDIVML